MTVQTRFCHNLQKDEELIYPRVLVINGEPFWQGSGTGLTMTKLFKDWPKESLACLFVSRVEPDYNICERNWRLDLLDLRCLSFLIGKGSRKKQVIFKSDKLGKLSFDQRKTLAAIILKKLKKFRQHLAGTSIRDLDFYRIPEYILKEINEFKPQVIYSMLAFNRLLKLVIDISDQFSIPIVPHFMDDWPTTLYQPSFFRSILRKQMCERITAVFDRSPKRMVIGDAMAEEYARKYGGEFLPFMNAVEPEFIGPVIQPKMSNKVRLIYVGGLHLNRWRSLRDIGMCIKLLGDEGVKAEVQVFSQPGFDFNAEQVNIPPAMRFVGPLFPAEVPKVLREADILIHVESFDCTNRTYTRYSVSTKIPEYMGAVRPILAYGPEELASIKYVRESGAGLAVGQQNMSELISAIRELVMSKELRDNFGVQGYKTALKEHNAALQRQHFRSIIFECAIRGKKKDG